MVLNPEWSGEVEKLLEDADKCFRSQSESLYLYCIYILLLDLAGESNGCSFLETESGRQFIPVFKAIRLQHILNDVVSVKTLEADGIIPESE